jgi:putative spermidine/putrescine transport system substrate-binding protein
MAHAIPVPAPRRRGAQAHGDGPRRPRSPHRPRRRGPALRLTAALSAVLFAAGCGSASGGQKAAGFVPPPVPTAVKGVLAEDQLNIVVWSGYAEQSWVKPFEDGTGCHVNVTTAGSSDEMVALMKSGEYDVVSASGDASLRLIASGDVAPVDTKKIAHYGQIYANLAGQSWNSVNNSTGTVVYGVPQGRGSNILLYNKDKVNPPPTSWAAVFDPSSKYKGRITAYDSPIYIADAALYLMRSRPELGIKDPYELDQGQLSAAVDLLKAQRPILSGYWTDSSAEQKAFENGTDVLGTSWQLVQNGAAGDDHKEIQSVALPVEGATGWSDSWMISAGAKHPTCAYDWIDYVLSPQVNATIAQFFGEAPANQEACKVAEPGFCDAYHAGDTAYWSKIHYWRTPVADCGDSSDRVCTTYTDWVVAWNAMRQ